VASALGVSADLTGAHGGGGDTASPWPV